jgi:N12 class adenine-specific DNA methylase
VAANLAALQVLRNITDAGRPATADEQRTLARWSGWGATPAVFDPGNDEFGDAREQLQQLLTPAQYQAAARTTLNAHYTDAALAAVMWDALEAAGFAATTGRVLEPGCGAGNFLGLAPESARDLVGVELDPTTAAIASALYPHAQIRAESFADTRLAANSFDLTIGNVPFAKTALHDKVHNPGRHAMHNHFILKSLALTRPGGVVAVLTSHWTMDATNPAARREIAGLADLVTAIRLPGSAHQRAAGTQVITDLLVLRRRDQADEPLPGAGDWELVDRIGGDDQRAVNVNRYFQQHPEQVIGEIGTRTGQFGPELAVRHDGDTPAAFRAALTAALDRFTTADGPLFTTGRTEVKAPRVLRPDAPVGAIEGHIEATDDGRFTVVRNGQLQQHPVPASQAKELRALLALRDVEVALLAAEAATTDDTPRIAELRGELNRRYDAYAAAYGPLNRVKTRRTGNLDPDTGEQRMARIRPPQGGFRTDPHSPAVYALENYDAGTGTATKSAIFTERVVAPRPQRLGADTAEDATAICLDTHGEIRLPDVARLLGVSEPDARAALGRLVFNDPAEPNRLIPAAEYLSGNVRIKLADARAAAERDGDGRWADNIEALVEVQPVDLTPAEITVRLGASWIGADVVAEFLRETLDDRSIKVENPGGSTWSVKGNHHSVLATTTYGTSRASAVTLAQSLLEQRVIKIYDELDDGRRIPNLTETVAAQEKATELNERFADWVWDDPDRAARLARIYNDTFNAIVLRSYDGAHRQFPGLAVTIELRPHQVAAVVRMLSEPSVLLAHEVGAGKTLEMVVGCMKLRRLGMARKPAVVVPNHMLEQFSREWLQAYPQAKVLAAGIDDVTRDRRRLFVARAATGDWDAVILSLSAFQRLALTPEHQQDYYDHQLATLRARLDNSRAAGGLTVKRLESALQRAEERLKNLTDLDRDPAVSFESTGIDYLCIDEAHGYKNLQIASNIPGASNEGSQRASDLDMKLHYLRERHGHRVATFATATPIANSVAEAYVMQRFLRPDVLDAAGLTDFDVWAATFGEVTTDLELTPDGSGYKMKSRFAKFRNVPELLRMWHLSADIKTAEDLNLPTPAIAGGKAETIVVPATGQLTAFMADLARRADKVQAKAVDPREDNILRVASHGRMAALDLRLLPHEFYAALPARDPGERTKLDLAADRIAAIHYEHAERAYPNHPTRGALQLVFCDLGTPDGAGWNAYSELRRLLVDRGVPAEAVRFMHEAHNDREKGELFAAARTGRISVLIGSTEKMGVGTNVQARAIALHHLECPWRPADLAQRDGRAIRQGNLNNEVALYRYVTESSFDGYTWQTVERKARFIAQVMRGKLDVREIEDVGDVALSYAEVKALACGDPRILEKARVDSETTRLERLHRSWTRTQRALDATITATDRSLPSLHADLDRIEAAITRIQPTRGEAFTMSVAGARYTSRADAAIALRQALVRINPAAGDTAPTLVAQLGGFNILASGRRFFEPHLRLELADVPRTGLDIGLDELRSDRPLGIVTRLENRVAGLPVIRDEVAHQISRASTERDRAAAELGQPFPHAESLDAARRRGAELEAELAAEATGETNPAEPGLPPTGTRAAHTPAGNRLTPDPTGPAAQTTDAGGDVGGRTARILADQHRAAVQFRALGAPSPEVLGKGGTAVISVLTDPGAAATEPAKPGEPEPNASEPGAPTSPAARLLRVAHTPEGTLVHGTERGDQQARKALKANGFKWARNLDAWYLPRSYRYETRSMRVRALSRMLGDRVSVDSTDQRPAADAPVQALSGDAQRPPAASPARSAADPESDTPDEPPAGTTALDADRLAWARRLHPRGAGPYAVWDMRDGRFGAVRAFDGLPQGGVVGDAYARLEQAEAFVDALNDGATPGQAQLAARRTEPGSAERGAAATLVDNAPPGGWTDTDRVPERPARDTSGWPSVQRYPRGAALTVHAVGADGPGRRLGHGTVVDHPGPSHVVVESPWGTRRTAAISHVQPIDPAELERQAPAAPTRTPPDSWQPLVNAIDPAIGADPAWPALAYALQHAQETGYPAREQLAALANEVLPDDNPARALHYRLVADTEAAAAAEPRSTQTPAVSGPTPAAPPLPGTTTPHFPGPPR